MHQNMPRRQTCVIASESLSSMIALLPTHNIYRKHVKRAVKGFAKKRKIRVDYGSGWVQVSLGIFFGKIIPIPKPVLIFGVVYHVNYVCIYSTLLKVVSYYDLSVLSMSVMGFHKKVWMGGGWVG